MNWKLVLSSCAAILATLSALLFVALWAPRYAYPDVGAASTGNCPSTAPRLVEGLCLTDAQVLQAKTDRAKTQNDLRAGFLQGFAGFFLIVGAGFTYLQWRTTREGQVTDRYTKANDQLQSQTLSARVGAIYALERIARDSRGDRQPIAEVLCTYVRTAARENVSDEGLAHLLRGSSTGQDSRLDRRAPDVNAALTVLADWARRIGRGPIWHRIDGPPWRDLHGADLRGWQQSKAQLANAFLHHAKLAGADLQSADLRGANLFQANLEGAALPQVDLRQADLREADLKGADLRGANLKGAQLEGAKLAAADLFEADLAGASADGQTTWPEYWSDLAVRRNAGVREPADPTTH